MQTILITGGAGYIGSYVNKLLCQQGYQTLILDNLSSGRKEAIIQGEFIKGDIGDRELLAKIFKEHKIDAVMHFAASIDVGESVKNPLAYYNNNVSKSIVLLEEMLKHQIHTFIFSSTAALFSECTETKIHEDSSIEPLSPYGRSKWMVEETLRDLNHATPLKSCALRYFNAAGADPEGEISLSLKPHNLIPAAVRALLNKEPLTIFGTDYPTKDGTCVRDYIHIHDLATAHILAMKKLIAGTCRENYNLGNGAGYSVREVLDALEHASSQKIQILEGPRREGDSASLVCDSSKAQNELGWTPIYPELDDIVKHAWQAASKFANSPA